MNFKYLYAAMCMLMSTAAVATINQNDFVFHEDGDVLVMDGNGSEVHIDYVGPVLVKPLTIRIKPNNPDLKIIPSTCIFTKNNHECKPIVRLVKNQKKVYGIIQYEIAEIADRSQASSISSSGADANGSVMFGTGVTNEDSLTPVLWNTWYANSLSASGSVFLVNSTNQARQYKGNLTAKETLNDYRTNERIAPTYTISLPAGGLCYVDEYSVEPLPTGYTPFYIVDKLYFTGNGRYFSDITNPKDPIFNAPYQTGNNNISTCSANGQSDCASNKWASWTVGMANLGPSDLAGGLRAGQAEVLRDNSWNNGATIYYESNWSSMRLALILIEGSTDGSGFNASAALPGALQLKAAAPCSMYVN